MEQPQKNGLMWAANKQMDKPQPSGSINVFGLASRVLFYFFFVLFLVKSPLSQLSHCAVSVPEKSN